MLVSIDILPDENINEIFSLPDKDNLLDRLVPSHEHDIFVIRKDSNIIGWFSYNQRENDNILTVETLYIRLNYRGYGFGKDAVNRIITDVKKYKFDSLEAEPVNKEAKNFWLHCGFQEVSNIVELIL